MKLSQKRRQEVFNAVHNCITDVRIKISKELVGHPQGSKIDIIIAQCGAEYAAIKAIEK